MSKKLSEVEMNEENIRVIGTVIITNYKIGSEFFNIFRDQIHQSKNLEDFTTLIKKAFILRNTQNPSKIFEEAENYFELVKFMNAVLKHFGFKEEF